MPAPPCSPESADVFLSTADQSLTEALRPWPARVLVLGAGGKMGLHVCLMLRLAAPAETEIVAVSRFGSLRDREAFTRHGITTLSSDLSVSEDVARLPDAELIYFLAGVKFGTTADPDLLHRTNVLVPRLVAARFRGARIVALSTGCVYPFVPVASAGARETTLPAPVGEYAESCLQREAEFARAAELDSSTRVVLIRLNYAVEFRYGVLVDIASKVLRGEPVDVTMGHVNVIWQRDAVKMIIRAQELADRPARPLNVTGDQTLRVRDLAMDFARIFGVSARVVGAEAATAWLNDASFAHQRWGRPRTALATMEQWIAAWLLAGFPTWGKPTGFQTRDGKF